MSSPSNNATTLSFPAELPTLRRGNGWLARAGDVDLKLTNLEKVFWPESGYTKGDLLTYYFNVALTLIPHVADRPLTLKRMPYGVDGPYFYEKDAPSYTPGWVPTLEVPAEGGRRKIRFVTIRDVASLLWVVNLGCIELHPHHTRGDVQEHPTYAVFDLDPFPPAGFDECRYVASLVKVALDRLDLVGYPKTSGGSGLQIYVPLDGKSTYAEVRAFVTRVCDLVHTSDPHATTREWEIARRAGRVFLDALMNRAGASFAAPYSVRSRWEAPVSMPFEWDELTTVDPDGHTIGTALERLTERGDPFEPVAHGRGQDLRPALASLDLR